MSLQGHPRPQIVLSRRSAALTQTKPYLFLGRWKLQCVSDLELSSVGEHKVK